MKIIGHRGARNEAPENTVESFIHAQNNGCLHFELDVQLSSDHELMVFHDKSLKRTCGLRQLLKQVPYDTLKNIDARIDTPGWKSPCHIPRLQDVIEAVPNTLSWQFEVKKDSRKRMLIMMYKLNSFINHKQLSDKATITSGCKWFLKSLKLKYPKIKTGYVAEFNLNRPVYTAQHLNCKLLVLNDKLVNNSRLEKALNSGLEVSCWTVNDIVRMELLKKIGISSVITDYPTNTIKHFHKKPDHLVVL